MSKTSSSKRKKANLSKATIIVFDLEYYVPPANRPDKIAGLTYNPAIENNILLGGGFCVVQTSQLERLTKKGASPDFKMHWIWEKSGEKELILDLHQQLLTILEQNQDIAHFASPLLCGIGITHSDWPTLMHLFVKHDLLDHKEAFVFQSKFRTLDLQVLGIPFFKPKRMHLYPKVKEQLQRRFIGGPALPKGTEVWKLYEEKNYLLIEDRVKVELNHTIKIYQQIHKKIKLIPEL